MVGSSSAVISHLCYTICSCTFAVPRVMGNLCVSIAVVLALNVNISYLVADGVVTFLVPGC